MSLDNVIHTRLGAGRPGYCKICDSPFAFQINYLLNQELNATQISKALAPFNFSFDRATLRKHRDHSSDPKTTFAKMAKEEGAVRTISNEEYLERVRDAAAKRVEEDPGNVTVDQGIQATKVLMQDRTNRDSLRITLMKVMTGRSQEVIEGEWSPVMELEASHDGAASD